MNKKENPMNISLQGILFGILLSLSVLLFIGATNDNNEIGRYEYYINSDDVTKKHYSRIQFNHNNQPYGTRNRPSSLQGH